MNNAEQIYEAVAPCSTLNGFLRFLRLNHGFSLMEIATKLGVAQATVCTYEIKMRKLPVKHVFTLSQLYQVPFAVFAYYGRQTPCAYKQESLFVQKHMVTQAMIRSIRSMSQEAFAVLDAKLDLLFDESILSIEPKLCWAQNNKIAYSFGTALRNLRMNAGYDIMDIATYLDIRVSTFSVYESKVYCPSFEILDKVSERYQYPFDNLIYSLFGDQCGYYRKEDSNKHQTEQLLVSLIMSLPADKFVPFCMDFYQYIVTA